MKDECAVVKDLALLYYDNALCSQSINYVNKHLKSCDSCKDFYVDFEKMRLEDEAISENKIKESKKFFSASKKIKKYRFYQLCLFGGTIIFLLSLVFTWFGYSGVSQIKGTTLLTHPCAVLGFGLLELSIWYSFTNNKNRKLCGYIGIILLLICQFLVMGLALGSSTVGFDIGFIHLELLNPIIQQWDFSMLCFGFFVSLFVMIIEALFFRLFCSIISK